LQPDSGKQQEMRGEKEKWRKETIYKNIDVSERVNER
jgi:hypothetical protein